MCFVCDSCNVMFVLSVYQKSSRNIVVVRLGTSIESISNCRKWGGKIRRITSEKIKLVVILDFGAKDLYEFAMIDHKCVKVAII